MRLRAHGSKVGMEKAIASGTYHCRVCFSVVGAGRKKSTQRRLCAFFAAATQPPGRPRKGKGDQSP